MQLIALVILLFAFANSYLPSTIPDPKIFPERCGLNQYLAANERWVCDVDGLLERDVILQMNDIITQTYSQTKKENAHCAVEIAVVVIEQMDSSFEGSAGTFFRVDNNFLESFARKLHNYWGVGSKDCQNGVLIFLSKNDRNWFISVGKGK